MILKKIVSESYYGTIGYIESEKDIQSKYHLLSEKKYIQLLDFIKRNNMQDCSHKNIMINGICHYQFPNNPIVII